MQTFWQLLRRKGSNVIKLCMCRVCRRPQALEPCSPSLLRRSGERNISGSGPICPLGTYIINMCMFREILASMAHPMYEGSIFGSCEMDFISKGWPIVEELRIIHLHHRPPLQGGLCPSLWTAFNWFERPWMGGRRLEIPPDRWWEPKYVFDIFIKYHLRIQCLRRSKEANLSCAGYCSTAKFQGHKCYCIFGGTQIL